MNDNSKIMKDSEDHKTEKNVYNYVDYERVNDEYLDNDAKIDNKSIKLENPANHSEEINQLEKLINENSVICADDKSIHYQKEQDNHYQIENKVIKQVDRYLKIRDKDIESFKDKWQYEQLNEN